ncbi:hypothetical protein E2562_029942 [Oryza meyeriana var. granulata]|uniref:Uncharacterized protein n=1 Tax=Oryza meyeriana var. granulata TaxID=110450 RepID=A0A6G1CTS0_9ORYZ|nr:hypothetical protein E2562_029942 [Oryza meyeriana var. granulata]
MHAEFASRWNSALSQRGTQSACRYRRRREDGVSTLMLQARPAWTFGMAGRMLGASPVSSLPATIYLMLTSGYVVGLHVVLDAAFEALSASSLRSPG